MNRLLLIVALASLVVTDSADARGRLRGRLRRPVERTAQAARNTVEAGRNVVRGCVGGSCSTPTRQSNGCDNPNCDCVNCQCEDCDCNSAPRKEPAPGTTDHLDPKTMEFFPHADEAADVSEVEQRVIASLNRLRAKHGRPALIVDPILMKVCRERVRSLSPTNPHHSHVFGSEMSHASRYAEWRTLGGVVAGAKWSDGSPVTPESAVDGWRQSDGHRMTILGFANINDAWHDRKYDRVGVGVGPRYYVAIAAKKM